MPVFRRDLENQAYQDWVNAEGEAQKFLKEEDLRGLLKAHAQAVQYAVLRRQEPDLVTEAVDKVMLNLPTFQGEALFTTWAHKILLGVMYDQRRVDRKTKETSLDVPGFDIAAMGDLNVADILLSVRKLLKEPDYQIFEQLILMGNSHEEAAGNLGIPRASLSRKWTRIVKVLKHGLAERLQTGR